MPQIITDFRRAKRKGPVSKYPFALWFETCRRETNFQEGKGLRLVSGVDFNCSQESMLNRLRKETVHSGIRLSMYRQGADIILFYVGQVKKAKRPSPKQPAAV